VPSGIFVLSDIFGNLRLDCHFTQSIAPQVNDGEVKQLSINELKNAEITRCRCYGWSLFARRNGSLYYSL